jgi:hypothetical protein
MRQTLFVIVALFAVGWVNETRAQADVEKLVADLNPAIQAHISATYNALQQPRVDPRSSVDVFREVQTLKGLTDDKSELVKQLAIFVVTTTSEEDMHVILALGILHFLDLPPSIPIHVLAPYLDTANQQLRLFVRSWFQSYDKAAAEDPLKAYRSYVGLTLAKNEEVPIEFIKYVYERYPGRALLVFVYADRQADISDKMQVMQKALQARRQGQEPGQDLIEEGRQLEIRQQEVRKERSEILLAEHIINNAIWLKEKRFDERFQQALPEAADELAKLAKHDEWWVRLYVAEMMRQHRELRQTDVLQQLSEDINPLVSKTAKSAQ